ARRRRDGAPPRRLRLGGGHAHAGGAGRHVGDRRAGGARRAEPEGGRVRVRAQSASRVPARVRTPRTPARLMSHLALRRVMVRMLHDPAFTAAVYADPAHALAGVDLTTLERRWLAEAPPAAWRTDPERPARVLAALLDEFPGAAGRAPARVARFFTSEHF